MLIEKLKVTVEKLLPTLKNRLQEAGEIEPMVFNVDSEGHIRGMYVATGAGDKRTTYGAIAAGLKQTNAAAAIVVNDGYMKIFSSAEEPEKVLKNYMQGDFAKDYEAIECLIVGIKGPDIETTVSINKYVRNEVGDIVFEEKQSVFDDGMSGMINILPNWW